MTASERLKKLEVIKKKINDGCSEITACMSVGHTVAWYHRWQGRYETARDKALSDIPRCGRPSTIEDDAKLTIELNSLEKKIKTIEGTTNAMKENVKQIQKRISGGKV